MKKFLLACVITTSSLVSLSAFAAAQYTTEESSVGELLDNPQARAILDKHLPGFSSSDQIDMARGMTLKSIQQFAPDDVTDDALAKIDADLASMPADKK